MILLIYRFSVMMPSRPQSAANLNLTCSNSSPSRRVLGTSEADVRERVVRGRRWLEIPASEVHDLSTANWMRLTEAGRTVLIQP